MEGITGLDVRSFFIVVAALVVFMNGILGLAKNIKEISKPNAEMADWRKKTDQRLKEDDKRLNNLEEGNDALCKGMLAMLNHEITGNSIDKLKEAQQDLTEYLIGRR